MNMQPDRRELETRIRLLEEENRLLREEAEALRRYQVEHTALYERNIFCVYAHDLDGNFLDANDAALRLLGYSRDEIRGLSLSTILDEENLQRARETLEEIVRTGSQSRPTEYRVRKRDGTRVWIETEACLLTREGRPSAVQGIALDITVRKEAEEALRGKEERYRRLFEDSPISLWEEDYSDLWDYIEGLRASGVDNLGAWFAGHPEGLRRCASLVKILNVNKATLKMYHAASVQDFIGGLDRIFDQDAYRVFERGILALAEGETRFESEAVNSTLKGEKKQILIRWTVVPGSRRPFGNILVSVIDITGIKSLERERANLTAMFAHDIKSSLVAIQGLVMRMLNRAETLPAEKQAKYLEIVRKEAGKLEFLVDDFLESSRVQAVRLNFSKAPFSVEKELREFFELYQPLALEKGLRLELDCAAGLPLIEADANRLRRVFLNLLDNAFKFSTRPGARVTLSAWAEADRVEIRIADQGTGIDPEDLPFVFDPFHRGRNGSEPLYRGHGVGLAAVKSIVEGHGGQVFVASEKGKGSVFTVRLPTAVRGSEPGSRPEAP